MSTLRQNSPEASPELFCWRIKCLCHKKNVGTVWSFTKHLHHPPEPLKVSALEPSGTSPETPEPHQVSAPEPSRTSQGLCTGTFWNLTLHRNLPEPHQVSAPEPFGTSPGICAGTLRNLVRNLVLKLHRIAPELIWAKDPIEKFFCWGIIPTRDPKHCCQEHDEEMPG